jgi:glucose-1-phosphate thymidylyltransferase
MSYEVQPKLEGLAQAFVIAKDFIGDENCCLILGDNLFFGQTLPDILAGAVPSF